MLNSLIKLSQIEARNHNVKLDVISTVDLVQEISTAITDYAKERRFKINIKNQTDKSSEARVKIDVDAIKKNCNHIA